MLSTLKKSKLTGQSGRSTKFFGGGQKREQNVSSRFRKKLMWKCCPPLERPNTLVKVATRRNFRRNFKPFPFSDVPAFLSLPPPNSAPFLVSNLHCYLLFALLEAACDKWLHSRQSGCSSQCNF